MRREQLTASQDESLDVAAAVRQLQGLKNPSNESSEQGPHDDDRAKAVQFDDGTSGWVIREETREERMAKFGDRYRRAISLADQQDQLFDGTRIEERNGVDPVEALRKKKGDTDPSVLKIMAVKKAFAGYAPSANGAALKGTPEAINYENAMRDLREGKFRLPTVDEYEQQKEELKKEKERNMDMNRQEPQTPVMQPNPPQTPTQQQPEPIEQRRDTNNGTLAPSALPPKRGEAEVAAKQAQKVQPLNLAKMEDEVKAQANQNPGSPVQQNAPEEPDQNVVQFNVEAKQTNSFYASLPDADKEKVRAAKVIKINETELKDIPTSIRTIDSLSEYRKILPRRISGEYVEVVLPNSGYIATMGASGSLAMATILPDPNTNQIDFQKRYQFCFNNLVNTSIGMLSFSDFILQTSPQDLDAMIGAIYRASCPPTQKITLNCGNPKCGKDYDITFNTNDLIDVDAFSNDTKIQINKIIEARDVLGKAKEVHNEAPVMVSKTYKLSDDLYITVKAMDGQMTIERFPLMQQITDQYGQLSAFLSLYVKEVRRLITPEGADKPEWFTINDPIIIADEFYNMTDEQLDVVRVAIDELQVYDSYQYSFKGPYHCPHCGREELKVACPLDELVFQKVSKVVNRE